MMKSEKINVYVATLAVWNVKLHNIHWNVEGHLFNTRNRFMTVLLNNMTKRQKF